MESVPGAIATGLSICSYVMGRTGEELREFNDDNPVATAPGTDLASNVDSWLSVAAHNDIRRNLSAFPITETELKLIAAAASIGLNSRPKNG